jgi:diketogulonate reductase-like aldo/keto reductase
MGNIMILNETFKLWNGIEIPKIGLGTWLISNDDVIQAVKNSIDIGYRHIDTAQAYENESGVGIAIQESNINRDEIFITTKVAAEIKSYKKAIQSIDESLSNLNIDTIDLMLIHSPKPWSEFNGSDHYFEGNLEVWRALENSYKAGKMKAIGISNFQVKDIKNILDNCDIKPMVNQILAHITNTPAELIEYCKKNDIIVEAYSPIGHGELLKNEALIKLAAKYNISVAQLCIRYCIELGLLPLPKSENPKHMTTNTNIDFEISQEDMIYLKKMGRGER